MFQPVYAVTFHRPMNNGKTKPCLISTVDTNKSTIEMVAKFAEGCEQKEFTLVIEALAAFLAADLNLPIPEPKLVQVDPVFANSLLAEHSEIKNIMMKSLPYAFGSRLLPPSYSTLTNPLGMLNESQIQAVAEIFAFDMLIKNPDRTIKNPNCLSNGIKFAIFDHDLSLRPKLFSFELDQWQEGYLNSWNYRDHVFFNALRGKSNIVDFDKFSESWGKIDDARLQEYRNALPHEWLSQHEENTDVTLKLIANIRDNITPSLNEVLRVLK